MESRNLGAVTALTYGGVALVLWPELHSKVAQVSTAVIGSWGVLSGVALGAGMTRSTKVCMATLPAIPLERIGRCLGLCKPPKPKPSKPKNIILNEDW